MVQGVPPEFQVQEIVSVVNVTFIDFSEDFGNIIQEKSCLLLSVVAVMDNVPWK